jgi:hypothetical protein
LFLPQLRKKKRSAPGDANLAKTIVMAEVVRLVEEGDTVIVTFESGTLSCASRPEQSFTWATRLLRASLDLTRFPHKQARKSEFRHRRSRKAPDGTWRVFQV